MPAAFFKDTYFADVTDANGFIGDRVIATDAQIGKCMRHFFGTRIGRMVRMRKDLLEKNL
jgi:hypothetical protein